MATSILAVSTAAYADLGRRGRMTPGFEGNIRQDPLEQAPDICLLLGIVGFDTLWATVTSRAAS